MRPNETAEQAFDRLCFQIEHPFIFVARLSPQWDELERLIERLEKRNGVLCVPTDAAPRVEVLP